MPRIVPLENEQMSDEARRAYDDGMARWGRMTNMKRTLLRSVPAYHALMQWYPLFDEIKAFTGERLAIVFAHAISLESACLICTTFMRRILVQWGENPNELTLDERGKALVEYGRAIARERGRVPDPIYKRVAQYFDAEQIVALTAFAALMVATNIINNALEVDLDEYLYEYRQGHLAEKEARRGG